MKVSIVTSAYNEEGNVEEFHRRVTQAMGELPQLDYEIIFADNASTDGTARIAREICARDARFKLIVNARNFGQVRSPTNAMYAASGDAVVSLVSDLQDPPERIPEMLRLWMGGARIVVAVRAAPERQTAMSRVRDFYYALMDAIGDVPAIRRFTGFGVYDRRVVDLIRSVGDPEPYVRGLISQIGLPIARIVYEQQPRKASFSKNRFLSLFDMAMLGVTSMSKAPLRMMTLAGGILSFASLALALFYLVAKLFAWGLFPAGVAPTMIMMLVLGSFQILCLGLIGEYIAAIHAKLQNRPMVVEQERVNFD